MKQSEIDEKHSHCWKRIPIPRERMLNNLGKIIGLDLYIVAQKG